MGRIIEKWKEILFISAVVAAALNFYGLRTYASEAKKKVETFEQTFQNIEQIAKSLQDPHTWLRNYLINYGIDSAHAKKWAVIPRCNEIIDSTGLPQESIPCLQDSLLPECGVIQITTSSGIRVLDTLWNM